jgi:hypothetical protein
LHGKYDYLVVKVKPVFVDNGQPKFPANDEMASCPNDAAPFIVNGKPIFILKLY